MANPDETQEIDRNLDEEDQDMQEESQTGHMGSLPTNPNNEEPNVHMQLGQTLPTQIMHLPFQLGIVGLPAMVVGIRLQHIQLIFRLLVNVIATVPFQLIIINALLGVQAIEIHQRVAHDIPNDINYDMIDDIIVLPPPVVFSPRTTTLEPDEQNGLGPALNATSSDTTTDQTTTYVQTTNEPRVEHIPPIHNVPVPNTTSNFQNEQSPIRPFSNQHVPPHRILPPPEIPMPHLTPIDQQPLLLNQSLNAFDDENTIDIEETNPNENINMQSSSNMNQTGDNQMTSGKRSRSLEEDEDDDSKPNSKRPFKH